MIPFKIIITVDIAHSLSIKIIDMRRVSRPPPHPFPLCADCVPFELVVSAALLGRKNSGCGGGGQTVFQIFTTIM
jgi:hypothetical protein